MWFISARKLFIIDNVITINHVYLPQNTFMYEANFINFSFFFLLSLLSEWADGGFERILAF